MFQPDYRQTSQLHMTIPGKIMSTTVEITTPVTCVFRIQDYNVSILFTMEANGETLFFNDSLRTRSATSTIQKAICSCFECIGNV